jgi:hypothetical protein
MPRVNFRNDFFEKRRSTSWYEKEFEALILDRSQQIFPRWTVVPFDAPIVGEDGTVKKPDLALLDPKYREWWIVEDE